MSDVVPFRIYVRERFPCRWCNLAVIALRDYGLPHEKIALGSEDLGRLAAEVGQDTVPIIFHGDKFIGGHDALLEFLNDNHKVAF